MTTDVKKGLPLVAATEAPGEVREQGAPNVDCDALFQHCVAGHGDRSNRRTSAWDLTPPDPLCRPLVGRKKGAQVLRRRR